MGMLIVLILVGGLMLYCLGGILFALFFVSAGITRIDANAKASGLGFRLIVLPGAMALWPLLARRWWLGVNAPPLENSAHRRAASGGKQ